MMLPNNQAQNVPYFSPCGSALLIAQGLLLCLGQASHYLIQVGLNRNDQDNVTWLWSSQVAPGMLTS